ncbi:Daunorubicin/doxorubicin resistance ATP-binding protein DrrA [bacterium HR39]|nr:Daunorubicin/doxorubicin resistance ATP-binding protein DrrA [bacterium HR39]
MHAHPAASSPEDVAAPAIELRGLFKVYRGGRGRPDKVALHGIDFTVPRGAFFGLLGPNGAGKSTTINILAGLVVKTAGTVRVLGVDLDERPRLVRRLMGVVPQELNIDAFFTPRETLEYQAGLYGVPKHRRRTDELLEALGLSDVADAYARTLSGGMRRRLLVAKALVHDPPVVILDEPTAGVDVELRRQLWAYMKRLNARGTTVVLTTHYLEEAEALCGQVAIIDHGRLVACGATRELVARLDEKELRVRTEPPVDGLPEVLRALGFSVDDGWLVVRYRPSRTRIGDLLEAVRAAGFAVRDLATREPDLEELFLRLVARGREDRTPEPASAP